MNCSAYPICWSPSGFPDVEVRVGLLALKRLLEPRVILRGVVRDEVHDQLDASFMKASDQILEVLERSELWLDRAEVRDVVSVVLLG